MELSLPHTLHLFNIFCENDGKENCAQVLEEEVYKMLALNLWMMSMIAMLLVWTPWISIVTIMIALVMMKISLISMSTFVEYIEPASTHQLGKIDFARGISIWKLNGCKRG